jgi:hypothetical protein
MKLPESRSHQLAAHILPLGSTELNSMLKQIHPEDLSAAWQSMAPWQCETVWERYRGARSAGRLQ